MLSFLCLKLIVGRRLGDRIDQSAREPRQFTNIVWAPCREDGRKQFIARHIDRAGHGESRRRDDDFANSTIHGASPSRSKTQAFQFGDLPADGRVVAAREIREFDDADRPAAFDPDQEREKGPIQRDARFAHQDDTRLSSVHHRGEIAQGVVELTKVEVHAGDYVH